MRGKSLVTLAILAVLAALAAMWLDRTPAPAPGQEIGGALYPELAANVNDVARIEIDFGQSTDRVTLKRSEAGWQVAEKQDYRADAGKIRQLLLRLSEAKILELKTANPENYHRLGVETVGEDSEAAGARVDLTGLTPPVSVIVGRQETRAGKGTYVRRSDESQSYLVDAELDPGEDIADWLDSDIIDIDAELVREVTIEHADGESLRLVGIEGRLALVDLPEGRELSSPAATDPIGRALSSLILDDVMPEAEFDGGEPQAVATFGLSDGRLITVRTWQLETGRFLALDVALTPAAETPQADAGAVADTATETVTETGADTDAEADKVIDTVAVQEAATPRADAETVARDQKRLAGWVYEVPSYKFEQVFRRTEDLLKPVADETAASD